MTSFLSRLFSVFKVRERKPNDIYISVNVLGTQVAVNSADIHSTKERSANFRDNVNRKYRRYDRLMRHKKIWAVLSYAKSIEAIYSSNSFYDLDKAYLDYRNALARFDAPDSCPSENEIQCAFRFCDMQNCIGKCEHRLSEEEKRSISNWNNFNLDYTNILEAVSKRFITYWDDTLGAYRNKSAYLNRLDYIINHLNEVKHRKGLSMISQVEDYVNKVQLYYIDLKSTPQNDNNATS